MRRTTSTASLSSSSSSPPRATYLLTWALCMVAFYGIMPKCRHNNDSIVASSPARKLEGNPPSAPWQSLQEGPGTYILRNPYYWWQIGYPPDGEKLTQINQALEETLCVDKPDNCHNGISFHKVLQGSAGNKNWYTATHPKYGALFARVDEDSRTVESKSHVSQQFQNLDLLVELKPDDGEDKFEWFLNQIFSAAKDLQGINLRIVIPEFPPDQRSFSLNEDKLQEWENRGIRITVVPCKHPSQTTQVLLEKAYTQSTCAVAYLPGIHLQILPQQFIHHALTFPHPGTAVYAPILHYSFHPTLVKLHDRTERNYKAPFVGDTTYKPLQKSERAIYQEHKGEWRTDLREVWVMAGSDVAIMGKTTNLADYQDDHFNVVRLPENGIFHPFPKKDKEESTPCDGLDAIPNDTDQLSDPEKACGLYLKTQGSLLSVYIQHNKEQLKELQKERDEQDAREAKERKYARQKVKREKRVAEEAEAKAEAKRARAQEEQAKAEVRKQKTEYLQRRREKKLRKMGIKGDADGDVAEAWKEQEGGDWNEQEQGINEKQNGDGDDQEQEEQPSKGERAAATHTTEQSTFDQQQEPNSDQQQQEQPSEGVPSTGETNEQSTSDQQQPEDGQGEEDQPNSNQQQQDRQEWQQEQPSEGEPSAADTNEQSTPDQQQPKDGQGSEEQPDSSQQQQEYQEGKQEQSSQGESAAADTNALSTLDKQQPKNGQEQVEEQPNSDQQQQNHDMQSKEERKAERQKKLAEEAEAKRAKAAYREAKRARAAIRQKKKLREFKAKGGHPPQE